MITFSQTCWPCLSNEALIIKFLYNGKGLHKLGTSQLSVKGVGNAALMKAISKQQKLGNIDC